MRQLGFCLPLPPLLERSPELAALTILETALTASEAVLLASYAELHNGALDGLPRGSSPLRARTVILHARRLAAALAAYRQSLERDDRREQRARDRINF